MADEELSVGLVVEGFEDFKQAFKDMDNRLVEAKEKLGDLGGGAKQASGALDSVGNAFDKNAARANKLSLAQAQLTDVQARLATETNALARAQLTVRADELKKQIEDLSKAEDTGAQSTKKMGLSLTDLKSGIDMALGAMRAFKEAAVKAFEFAQEGAQVLQLRETVKSLGINMDALRAASGGTVDDMTLISSAAKLLAGTTGELNAAMVDAAPRLLEIARAAVKLDPTIGSVAFVYESLAKGIQKNQPLLIDNANIVVKAGTAQEKLAESLGKSVAALTDEEKAVALLEATLEGGANMIDQMGGNIESATDSYAQFTAEVKNLTDGLKANVAEGLTPFIARVAESVTALNSANERAALGAEMFGDRYTVALQNAQRGVKAAGEELAIMNDIMDSLDEAAVVTVQTFDEYIATAGVLSSTIEYQNPLLKAQEEAARLSGESFAALSESQREADASALAASSAFMNAAAALGEMSKAAFAKVQIDELKKSLDAGKISGEEYEAAQRAILIQFGLMTAAEEQAQKDIDAITQAFIDGKIEPQEYARLIGVVKDRVDGLNGTVIRIGWDVAPPPPGFAEGGWNMAPTADYYKQQGYYQHQHGGTTGGRSMIVGEHGAEMLTGVPGGARVLSSPTTARMMAQNSITNNYNLTTNAMTRPGGLSLEFAAMQMGSR